MADRSDTTCWTKEPATERVDLRLGRATKELIERAAAIEDISVSAFVLANAVTAARQVIAGQERWRLSRRDSQRFVDALLDPLEPNEALAKAVERYEATREAREREYTREEMREATENNYRAGVAEGTIRGVSASLSRPVETCPPTGEGARATITGSPLHRAPAVPEEIMRDLPPLGHGWGNLKQQLAVHKLIAWARTQPSAA